MRDERYGTREAIELESLIGDMLTVLRERARAGPVQPRRGAVMVTLGVEPVNFWGGTGQLWGGTGQIWGGACPAALRRRDGDLGGWNWST